MNTAQTTITAISYLLGIAALEDMSRPQIFAGWSKSDKRQEAVASELAIDPDSEAQIEILDANAPLDGQFISELGPAKNVGTLIEGFARLPENWDSFGSKPISRLAIDNAKAAVQLFVAVGLIPDRVSPTPDDSVLFEFGSESASVLVELFGTGEIAAVKTSAEEEVLFDTTKLSEVVNFVCESASANA